MNLIPFLFLIIIPIGLILRYYKIQTGQVYKEEIPVWITDSITNDIKANYDDD